MEYTIIPDNVLTIESPISPVCTETKDAITHTNIMFNLYGAMVKGNNTIINAVHSIA
jgi:hypothetical protein